MNSNFLTPSVAVDPSTLSRTMAQGVVRPLHLGVDVGSTTVKLVVLDDASNVRYRVYRRHHADIRATIAEVIGEAVEAIGDVPLTVAVTGSGGLLLAQWLGLPFVQEVVASKTAIEAFIPQTDVAIELGGEDAKIIYLDDGIEQRMNGTCAGGTGAFIDRMATLLNTDAAGLDELAGSYTTIYPIASRCGVFAKTDVQPLLNEGARREDIAASIFQSVVTQTISGLACGRPIRGHVAFLGGPLKYLPQLRTRFIETLKLTAETAISPENAHLFVASGAALAGAREAVVTLPEVARRLANLGDMQGSEVVRLAPLFSSPEDYDEFRARHARDTVTKGELDSYRGEAYLGIDAGSTTIKCALVGREGEVLLTRYANNKGDVLGAATRMLEDVYATLPTGPDGAQCVTIGHATVTGYGEGMLLEALRCDSGEIETVAHLRGAQQMLPGVDSILDIGGQDMKFLRIRDGIIDHIMLNEACSSGCGSFIESFASSLGVSVQDFAAAAVTAVRPVDLGSRCTVFMNSRVKQAQKEGATVGDISAGLSYSVIKNALFKVIKMRDPREMGAHTIVQGGTFLNDAVLRAFENLAGRDVVRPDLAGNMGAYGAALLARERSSGRGSTLLDAQGLRTLSPKHTTTRCGHCANKCLITISDFGVDETTGRHRRFVTGNRCEKGSGVQMHSKGVPNLFARKSELLFDRQCLPSDEAPRGTVGIPRALNMYENYPFWHTFFTKLGYAVVLSDDSSKKTYEAGIESMPSESVCYPAKLSHGHVMNLLAKGVDFIWMPCVKWERQEDETAGNHYNCHIVMSYPEALKLNIEELRAPAVEFLDPYVPYDDEDLLARRLYEELVTKRTGHSHVGRGNHVRGSRAAAAAEASAAALAPAPTVAGVVRSTAVNRGNQPTRAEIYEAVRAAWAEDARFKQAMRDMGDEALAWIEEHHAHGIVLAGRPYHNDPEINHAIPELLTSFGLAVLTEDSVSWKARPERPIRVVDQWMYHSRLYAAAKFVTSRKDIDLIQLNSFGCGLDAITTDEVQEILEGSGKVFTVLKIDEVSNLGAARIRVRSLLAALKDKASADGHPEVLTQATASTAWPRPRFTQEMRDAGYTILAPQMAPIHFELIVEALRAAGYNLELLPSVDHGAVDAGLKYVNNDVCYPSVLVTGQIMEAVESGRYDLSRTAIIISQTGGGCRATNYIALIRKALRDAGHPDVPVISLTTAATGEVNPGFKVTLPTLHQVVYGAVLGDALMTCLYRTRPYEAEKGSAFRLYRTWMDHFRKLMGTLSHRQYAQGIRQMVREFDELPLANDRTKPRVGVVGEILVKYHPTANNQVIDVIESEGCEAVVPGFVDFFLYGMANQRLQRKIGATTLAAAKNDALIQLVYAYRKPLNDAFRRSKRFEPITPIYELADMATDIIDPCMSMGEGWLLTAEMVELITHGTPNVICTQPFACLPNHVAGKATIKELRRQHPGSNIVAVDYDPGASEVNQLNRIKLMVAVAFSNFEEEHPETIALRDAAKAVQREKLLAEYAERSGEAHPGGQVEKDVTSQAPASPPASGAGPIASTVVESGRPVAVASGKAGR